MLARLACTKLEPMAIYVIKQACVNDILATVNLALVVMKNIGFVNPGQNLVKRQ